MHACVGGIVCGKGPSTARNSAELRGEEPLRYQPGDARQHPSQWPELVGPAAAAEAAGDHDVDVAPLRPIEEVHDKRRRMLKVGVHHARPWRARRPQPRDDGTAESAGPRLAPAADHDDVAVVGRDHLADDGISAVVGVVHEDDIHVVLGEPPSRRATSGRTFPDSSRVGTITETMGANAARKRAGLDVRSFEGSSAARTVSGIPTLS